MPHVADDIESVKIGLLAGGASRRCIFLAGQLLAWRQLEAAGYFVASNPANSFFYLITAAARAASDGRPGGPWANHGQGVARRRRWSEMRLSVELCAIYWHFLLLVWLVLFGLLTGWTDDFVNICRRSAELR